jgi:hypothetical protein
MKKGTNARTQAHKRSMTYQSGKHVARGRKRPSDEGHFINAPEPQRRRRAVG